MLVVPVSAEVKSCDAYIGLCEDDPSLLRFVNWLQAELQLHGVICFISDRSSYRDAHAHCLAKDVMDSATLGIVLVTPKTFSSPYGMEELKVFLGRGNLVAILFGLSQEECLARDIIERRGDLWQNDGGFLWQSYGGLEQDWKETVNKLSTVEFRLFAQKNNWRDCILDSVALVGKRLGKSEITEKVRSWKESVVGVEYPFPRNESFVGREKELLELELALFGNIEGNEYLETRSRRNSKSKDRGRILAEKSNDDTEMEDTNADTIFFPSRGKKADDPSLKITSRCELSEKGIACISGESGIGKTELALEFAYRFAQRYKMVLWVGGEARYLCQNYLNLLSFLGIDNSILFEDNESTSLENLEEQSISRVRKELMRDIPYLLIIDNLESDKEWWYERNIIDILPPLGGATHVIISTRMPHVMNINPIRLLYLSAAEALGLMKGSIGDLPVEEISALRFLEEKVGRVPMGLAIVRAVLSEISISPTKLLDAIKHIPHRNLTWVDRQDPILMYNRGMVQLFDVCLALFDLFGEHGYLASRMVQACGWFSPSPIPIPLLAAAASTISRENDNHNYSWKRWLCAIPCVRISHNEQLEAKATEMLVRLRVARVSTRSGFIYFHDIIKLYMRKRGNFATARSMVHVIMQYGSPRYHSEHIWAASFLLFNFGSDPVVISLEVPELLDFIRKCVLPLAWDTYAVYFRFGAALELLYQAMKALEAAKVGQFLEEDSLEWVPRWRTSKGRPSKKSDPHLHKQLASVEATLLETFFKMMHRGPMKNT
ncbi:unnamed protein product [Spirodela intermedia]|uniref:TIR domain-containing protein n=1 Tax=Spirodela intermedia TaxID=51605 RepID=A0A7I8JK85_SPIIN|nr:unnamed protein product [Spirodela intermedia]CAA6670470.1 unnamed protein product [Spirodela intermedia]